MTKKNAMQANGRENEVVPQTIQGLIDGYRETIEQHQRFTMKMLEEYKDFVKFVTKLCDGLIAERDSAEGVERCEQPKTEIRH